ncbi:MAG: thioesterase family protein [Verrucomicrobiota bacterium]
MSEKIFHHTHRVTYAECTVGNHIYYSRYLELLEKARGEFFRSLELPLLQWQQDDTIFPVVEAHLRYKAPARYDDLLAISVWLARLQGVRMNFSYHVLNQNNLLLLEAETFHVCSGLNEKPKRLPQILVEKMNSFLDDTAAS